MQWPAVTNRTCRHCGASSEIYCTCGDPSPKRVAGMSRWPDDVLFTLQREIADREGVHERRKNTAQRKQKISLRSALGTRQFYRPEGGRYAEDSQQVIDWLHKGYNTLAQVDDVRLLAAYYACDCRQAVDLFLPYLEMTA